MKVADIDMVFNDRWTRDKWDRWDTNRYDTLIDSLVVKNKAEERKKEMKTIYYVKFDGTEKLYGFFSKVPLQLGAKYNITADHITDYKNYVTVIKTGETNSYDTSLRTITSATMITGNARPDDRIKRVIFNKEKLTTVVIWWDNQKTIVKCQEGDVWDEEKALALCYMKRVLGNRGSFNEVLKKYCNLPEEVED